MNGILRESDTITAVAAHFGVSVEVAKEVLDTMVRVGLLTGYDDKHVRISGEAIQRIRACKTDQDLQRLADAAFSVADKQS